MSFSSSGGERGVKAFIAVLVCFILSAAITLSASGCNGRGGASSKADAKEIGGEAALATNPNPIAISTAQAVSRAVPSCIEATGSLIADESSDVAPQVSGRVQQTPVNVGSFVRAGDVIARLDDSDARLRLRQAELGVQAAQTNVRQAEARLGLQAGGTFNASAIPEARAAVANYEQAIAELRQAESNERRYRDLVETGDISMGVYEGYRTQRDTARARVKAAQQAQEAALNTARQSNQAIRAAQDAVEAARANVTVAQKAIADSIVRAPYAGYVSNRPVAIGEYVTPASVIATVLRTNPIKLQLQITEAEAPFVRAGMNVSLQVEAFRERNFAGQISAVNPAIDPTSRAVIVEALVPNNDNSLRAGMFATARIMRQSNNENASSSSNAVFLPRAAVLHDPNTQSYRAFVIQGDTAKLRVVQLGAEEGDLIRILSGVNADETVATNNLQQLYEGAKVRKEGNG